MKQFSAKLTELSDMLGDMHDGDEGDEEDGREYEDEDDEDEVIGQLYAGQDAGYESANVVTCHMKKLEELIDGGGGDDVQALAQDMLSIRAMVSSAQDGGSKERFLFDTACNKVHIVKTVRQRTGDWKDGPSGRKSGDFETIKSASQQGVLGGKKRAVQGNMAAGGFVTELDRPYAIIQFIAMRSSMSRALKDNTRGQAVKKAIEAEIANLEQPGVLQPVHFRDIPKEHRRDIIGTYMFHTEKYKADGSFDKDKCRLVLLSNLRNQDSIGETFCPTVNPISVFTQLNLAAVREGTSLAAYDIKGAFLLTPMQDGKRMFMKVGKDLSEHWVKLYPQRKRWVQADGSIYFELKRYVYGLHEAPKEFNGLLDKHLREMGFTSSKADACLYTKKVEAGVLILSVHVDDMLLTCPTAELRQWFEVEMEKHFQLVKQYDKVSYLGMTITAGSRGIRVDQEGFLSTIVKKQGFDKLKKAPKTPATDNLMQSDPENPLKDKSNYLSLIMSLMYLARFTRPDILMVVSFLTSKCSKPTKEDLGKAERVVKYLAGTANMGLEYRRVLHSSL
jgi:hypothetical protein